MNIELHSAFVYDCENCGAENFIRAMEGRIDDPKTQSEGMIVEYLASNDALSNVSDNPSESDDDDGMFETEFLSQMICVAPPYVKCHKCGQEFETDLTQFEDIDDDGSDDDDEDDEDDE